MTALALELCASAVAGGPVPLERAPKAEVAFTDGATIFLGADVEADAVVARRAVIVQAALIASGSLDRAVLRKVSRHGATVHQRYLTLEVVRSCIRADSHLPRTLVDELGELVSKVSSSPRESLKRAQGVEPIGSAPAWFGELHPLAVLRAGAHTPGDRAAGDRQAADLLDEPDADEGAEPTGGRSRIMELMSAPMRNPLGDALQRMLGMGRSAGDGTAGAEVPVSGRRSGKVGPQAQVATGAPSTRITMAGHLVTGAAYPEWDVHRGRYRADHCLVGEFDPADGAVAEAMPRPMHVGLVRELARLGLAPETHRGETTGEGLDLTALVELRTRIASGGGGEAAIHTSHRRTAQRLGVLILLDATGSTAEESDGRRIFEGQRALAHDLTSALDRLGVRVATYAFYSNGRKNVRFLHCKTFDERWGLAERRRLEAVAPTGFTRFGAAVRHGTHVLATRSGTEQQLLVVISDGVAYDDGGYESRYAVADSRRAIEEAADRGVAVVGLSVSELREGEPIWPAAQHRVVEGPAELAIASRELIGGALARARRAPRPSKQPPSTRRTHVRATV